MKTQTNTQTAQESYESELLDLRQNVEKLQRFADSPRADASYRWIDWGHAGDLAHLNELLERALTVAEGHFTH